MEALVSLPMDYAHISVFTPFPGTAIYREALAGGLYDHDPWREFALQPREDFTPPLWTENFSREELIEKLFAAYRAFYRRPGYLWRQLKKVRSFGDFYGKFKTGLKLLSRV